MTIVDARIETWGKQFIAVADFGGFSEMSRIPHDREIEAIKELQRMLGREITRREKNEK